jgi:hypothetical protein
VDVYSAGFKRLRLNEAAISLTNSRVAKGQDLTKEYGLLGTLFGEDRVIGISVVL